MRNRRLPYPLLLLLLLFAIVGACRGQAESVAPVAAEGSDIELPLDRTVVEARVPRNGTLAEILRDQDLPEAFVHTVVDSARQVFDPRRLRADHSYRVIKTLDGIIREFQYEIDRDQFLRVMGLDDTSRPPDVEVVEYEKQIGLVALRGGIDAQRTSLVAAVDAAGENVELAMSLADVFAGEVDFNSDLQRGDDFQVLFETQLREGEFSGYGPIAAAEFSNGGRRLRAFRFQVPGERPGYYDAEGRSLRRMFLRSPLKFAPTVTSGFSRRRLHPVLRTYRPHWGVDYRAPYGAPVIAVANGTVVSAGMSGGSGRMVRLRHASGYQTYYLHLSKIPKGIRPGIRVGQGDTIGYVGKSGLATGVHLDYRMRKNGVFVNPLNEHRNMPPGEPVPTAYLAAFESTRDRALDRFFPMPDTRVAGGASASSSTTN